MDVLNLGKEPSLDYFLQSIGGGGPGLDGINCHGPKRIEVIDFNCGAKQVVIQRTGCIYSDVAMAKLELRELQSQLKSKEYAIQYLLPILACNQMKDKEQCEKVERTHADLYEPD